MSSLENPKRGDLKLMSTMRTAKISGKWTCKEMSQGVMVKDMSRDHFNTGQAQMHFAVSSALGIDDYAVHDTNSSNGTCLTCGTFSTDLDLNDYCRGCASDHTINRNRAYAKRRR